MLGSNTDHVVWEVEEGREEVLGGQLASPVVPGGHSRKRQEWHLQGIPKLLPFHPLLDHRIIES